MIPLTAAPPTTQFQDSYLLPPLGRFMASLQAKEDGVIVVNVSQTHDTDDSNFKSVDTISTTANHSAFNLYASTKPAQTYNRARYVDISSDGQILRAGNRIFLPSLGDPAKKTSFVPCDFSLYIDNLDRKGKYLVVTSRQKVTSMPDSVNEDVKAASKDSINHSIENVSGDKIKTTVETPEAQLSTNRKDAIQPKDVTKSANSVSVEQRDTGSLHADPVQTLEGSSSEDEDLLALDDSVTEEELSAYESWSEASTEYSTDEAVLEYTPQPFHSSNPAEYGTDSDISSSDCNDCSSSADSSDDDSIIGELNRHSATKMGLEDEDNMLQEIYIQNDGYRPASDTDSDREADDQLREDAYDSTGWGLFGDANDFDGTFQAFESDSEDCSDCGDDGVACKMPALDRPSMPDDKNLDQISTPVGTPKAQIHVYDMAQMDEEQQPKRVFRYQSTTISLPYDSPPTLHPERSLVVWPLGDGKLLFADYLSNTYFVKRLRVSRMWSQQVLIQCRFAVGGKHLHIAILEMRGQPPRHPKPGKKGDHLQTAKLKEKKLEFDVVVYTYRLSHGKVTRAPPSLIARQLLEIGPSHSSPTLSWDDRNLFVACLRTPAELTVHKFKLRSSGVNDQQPRESKPSMLIIELPELPKESKISFLPATSQGRSLIIVDSNLRNLRPISKQDSSVAEHDKKSVDECQTAPCDTSSTQEHTAKSAPSDTGKLNSASSVQDEVRETKVQDQHTEHVQPSSPASTETLLPSAFAWPGIMRAEVVTRGMWTDTLTLGHNDRKEAYARSKIDCRADECWQKVLL